ncbi:MAG: SCO family protein [Gammaproteobacteria bacterium]|nr:SCO family protein [Gammaproteobacteria bacterium]
MSSKNSRWFFYLIMIGIVGVLSVLTMKLLNEGSHSADTDTRHAAILKPPKSLSPFMLTDQSGNAFTKANLEGKWTYLFSGFTNCPDICPPTMTAFKFASQELEQLGITGTQFLLLTVDPERDTSEVLNEFLSHFDSRFVGLTGSIEAINDLMRQLGLFHMHDHENHQVKHAGSVLLISPKAEIYAVLTAPIEVKHLVQTLVKINSAK